MTLPISFVIFSVLQPLLQIDSLKDLTSINFASIKGNFKENVQDKEKKKCICCFQV